MTSERAQLVEWLTIGAAAIAAMAYIAWIAFRLWQTSGM